MNNGKLINQDSGDQEYYTPDFIVEACRKTMGSIDLDPFSSAKANLTVGAKKFYTKDDDGFSQSWYGNVFVNHPFSRENNKKIFHKAIRECSKGNADCIMLITYASTSEAWFKPSLDFPQCYLYGRTNYILPDGTVIRGVTKGSCITLIADSYNKYVHKFSESFKSLGKVKVAV
jgi:ParB family chromosome partitioning protein